MKKLAVLVAAALVSASAFAGLGGAAINVNGTWYKANGWNDGDWSWCTGGDFSGDLGSIDSLELGGQIQFWDSLTGDGVTGQLYYKIDTDGAVKNTPISWAGTAGNNQLWQTGGSDFVTPAVSLTGLSDGSHTLFVWFTGSKEGNEEVDNNGGSNYAMTFSTSGQAAVPEPATMSLLGLGALAMVIRRKLRK